MLRILLLESRLDSGVSICHVLRARGYRVIFAQIASLGLEVLNTCVPDVVIVNAQMPGIDADDLLKSLRQNLETASIPVLFLTDIQEERECLAATVAWLVQPTDSEILQAIAHYVSENRLD